MRCVAQLYAGLEPAVAAIVSIPVSIIERTQNKNPRQQLGLGTTSGSKCLLNLLHLPAVDERGERGRDGRGRCGEAHLLGYVESEG